MAGRYKSILLFGAPGVGKGTQGHMLGNIPGFVHLATGDIFRSLDPDSERGRKFHEYSSQGLLVPDDFTIQLWRDYMQRRISQGDYRPDTDLLVLDGIPRNVNQASIVDEHIDVQRIIHLKAPNIDQMIQRMKRRAEQQGRTDDADESVIRRRFEVYDAETSPVLEHYDARLITDIDAAGTPAEVLLHVLEAAVPLCAANGFGNPLG